MTNPAHPQVIVVLVVAKFMHHALKDQGRHAATDCKWPLPGTVNIVGTHQFGARRFLTILVAVSVQFGANRSVHQFIVLCETMSTEFRIHARRCMEYGT